MKRYWISWIQTTDDYRPLQDPPAPLGIKGWWCSGYSDDGATLCAIVDAADEQDAEAMILKGWQANDGEVGEFRFVEERALNWLPGDRFPITKDWEKKRLAVVGKVTSFSYRCGD